MMKLPYHRIPTHSRPISRWDATYGQVFYNATLSAYTVRLACDDSGCENCTLVFNNITLNTCVDDPEIYQSIKLVYTSSLQVCNTTANTSPSLSTNAVIGIALGASAVVVAAIIIIIYLVKTSAKAGYAIVKG